MLSSPVVPLTGAVSELLSLLLLLVVATAVVLANFEWVVVVYVAKIKYLVSEKEGKWTSKMDFGTNLVKIIEIKKVCMKTLGHNKLYITL